MSTDRVIRFPTERRLQAAARTHAEAGVTQAQAVPAEQAGAAEGFAFLSIEIRRLPRTESWIGGDVAGRILNRCVLSALEALSKERVPVDLAGTVLRPVIEATFAGGDGVLRASRAAIAVRDAIRKVQRERENEFHVFGAITSGATAELEGGVKIVTGSPQQLAARFREHAAPSQILLSEQARTAGRGSVEVSEPAVLVTVPGSDPVPSYALNSLTS